MKRNSLFTFLIFIIVFVFTGCGSDNNNEIDVSMHDNWVDFFPWADNVQLAFDLSDHSITSGQPWGGVSTGTDNNTWAIDVKAGRKGSSGVADWFKSRASAAWCANFPSDCPNWPSELNFAMTGTLTINGTPYPVTIGQGSTGLHNNWWIGGPGWTLNVSFGVAVVTPDGKYFIEPVDDTFNQFWIRTSP